MPKRSQRCATDVRGYRPGRPSPQGGVPLMRDDYVKAALLVIDDPNILVNVVSRRVKQLKRGNRALVESLEKLSAEDTALREIIDGKIHYELGPLETQRTAY